MCTKNKLQTDTVYCEINTVFLILYASAGSGFVTSLFHKQQAGDHGSQISNEKS